MKTNRTNIRININKNMGDIIKAAYIQKRVQTAVNNMMGTSENE